MQRYDTAKKLFVIVIYHENLENRKPLLSSQPSLYKLKELLEKQKHPALLILLKITLHYFLKKTMNPILCNFFVRAV